MRGHRIVVAFALVVALGCKGKDERATQSFREGMEIICAAGAEEALQQANPAERQAAIATWIRARLRNPDAIVLFESFAVAHPDERAKMMDAAVRQAGLDRCALVPPDPFAHVTLPEVGDGTLEPLAAREPLLLATRQAIVVEGQPISAVRDGRVDPSELDGMRITRLAHFLAALGEQRGAEPLIVAVDGATPYRLFIQLMFTAKASHPRIEVVARAGDQTGTILIAIPAKAAPPSPSDPSLPPDAEPLGMAISMTADELMVWSMSGLEGTLAQPLLTVSTADLAAATLAMQQKLTEVTQRRWTGRDRAADDRRVVIMADQALPMAVVAPVMAAARRAPDGAPLFPDLMLSTGFD